MAKRKKKKPEPAKNLFRVTLHFALVHGGIHQQQITTAANDDVEARAKVVAAVKSGDYVVFAPKSDDTLLPEQIKFAEVQHIAEIDIL